MTEAIQDARAAACREREIDRVTLAGGAANLLLLALKFAAGAAGNSAAMLADAVHSLSDFATDIVVLVFVRIANKPGDKTHGYGHGKYETLATAIVGLLLLAAGAGILWNGARAVAGFAGGQPVGKPGAVALAAALASVAAKELLYRYTAAAGRRLNSQAVVANAWHHRSDALSSVGTAAGIGGAVALGEGWQVLDPVAAVAVSFFIIKAAVQLLGPCLSELVEHSLPEELERRITDAALSFEGVSEPHNLRTRRIGNYYSIDLHVRMDGDLTLRQAHDTASAIERRLRELFGKETLTNIHVEPKAGREPR